MGQLVASRLAGARRRIRICSPVVTSGPILATLTEVLDDGRCEVEVTVDGPQMKEALGQWEADGRAAWKAPLYEQVVASGGLAAKPSTPFQSPPPHNYMHAKVVVADDVVFCGSFNLSRSGEKNAENVVELHDPELAERLSAYVDDVRRRYPPASASVTTPTR